MSDNKTCYIYALKILVACLAFCFVLLFWCYCFYLTEDGSAKTVSAESSIRTVVIDAGHGGRDGGAVSDSGIKEKDLNLKVSFVINDVLKLCGIQTVMTREGDNLVCDENDPALKGKIKMTDLKNRLDIAESIPDSVFVSIHMNKFSVEKYSGLQVYYSPNNELSFELAKAIQDRIVEILQKDNTRKVKKAGSNIYLLDRIDSAAVLVECGFLSNQSEAKRLAAPIYRAQLALVMSDCILSNITAAANN